VSISRQDGEDGGEVGDCGRGGGCDGGVTRAGFGAGPGLGIETGGGGEGAGSGGGADGPTPPPPPPPQPGIAMTNDKAARKPANLKIRKSIGGAAFGM